MISFPASVHHVTFMVLLQVEIQWRHDKIHNRNTMYYNQVENYSSNVRIKNNPSYLFHIEE